MNELLMFMPNWLYAPVYRARPRLDYKVEKSRATININ